MRRPALALVLLAFLAACGGGKGDDDATSRTTTTHRATSSTTASTTSSTTTTTTASTVPAPAQPATAACPAVPTRRAPDANRPSYVLDLELDLANNAIDGRETVRFMPDLPTDKLVFRLWPNSPTLSRAGARLDVSEVYLGGTAPVPTQRPDATTLVVPVAGGLRAGQTIEATVPFRLTLARANGDRISRRGDTVRLGSFEPLLAWEPGVGWATEPPTALHAETSTAPDADWSMSVTVPAGLTVHATGDQRDGRWIASAIREPAIAIGRFRAAEGTANAPQPVHVTVAVESSLGDNPASYMGTVTRALTDFGTRFGAYPLDTYTLVLTPDLKGGIEYPGFVHQGPGSGGRSTPHEIGHQWFYGLVGSDQARDPWIDEGLASYAEARYLGNLGSFVGRDIPATARGHAGEPMTFWDAGRGSAYYRGVYVQGTQAVAALGPADRVDCALRHLVARQAYTIATTRDVISALQVVFPDADAVLRRFGIASRS
ncbi:MAG: hypothetical protein V7636_2565 [Actinomycetota bacterium]|jgi:hypothetical protein